MQNKQKTAAQSRAPLTRCRWCGDDELYVAYHDEEWGVPVYNSQALFERLVLEGMQAGLAWITVLKKREHMRRAFFGFDIARLGAADQQDMQRWLNDPGVIRHRGKLQAMVNNAQLTLQQRDFPQWLWSFAPPASAPYAERGQVPSATAESKKMSSALKAAGYKFVGPTICYAFMQSVGMVNDHTTDCWRHIPCAELRQTGKDSR